MATVANLNQDKDQDQPNTGGGGQVLSSAAAGGSSAAPVGGAPTPQRPPSSTPNINQYLRANQGAGQQLATGIQGNFQGQTNQLNQQVNTSKNQLENKYQPLKKELSEDAQNTIKTAFQDPQKLLKAQSSQQPSQDLNAYNQFQKIQSGGYGSDINAYNQQAQQATNQLQNQYAGLADQANAAKTEMGRFGLLRNMIRQPGYSQGQQTLDSLFLQAQPGVARQLQQNLGSAANQANQNIQQFSTGANAQANELGGLSAANQETIKNLWRTGTDASGQKLGATAEDIVAASQQRLEQAKSLNPALQNIQENAKTPANLTTEQLNLLGLSGDIGTALYGISPQNYISSINTNPSLAGVADVNDVARYRALQQLTGGADTAFGGSQDIGTYKPVEFNKDQFLQDVNKSRNTWENDYLKKAIENTAGSGDWSRANDYWKRFATELRGATTADQARSIADRHFRTKAEKDALYSMAPALQDYLSNLDKNRNNFLGTKALPSSPTGGIDWSQITAPTGGVKGGPVTEPVLAPSKDY